MGKVKKGDRMEVLEAEEAGDGEIPLPISILLVFPLQTFIDGLSPSAQLASLAIRWLEHGATLQSRWGGAAQEGKEARDREPGQGGGKVCVAPCFFSSHFSPTMHMFVARVDPCHLILDK